MRIGFIGVGHIGNPMAGQLLKAGHELVVHDIRREAAIDLLENGAVWADSPRVVAQRCEVVATCLPGPPEMEAVVCGPEGILAGIKPGAIYIDHTTNSPLLVRRVHAMLQEKAVAMLDAPVSGGMEGAQSRDLLVMVGGEEAVFQRCRPLLETIGKRVFYTGGIGSASVCKILHNCASFGLDLLLAECWTTGVKAGVKADTLFEIFSQAALGQMMSLKVRLPGTYLRGDFEPRFAVKLARKDLGMATELGRAYDVPMRLAALAEQEYIEALARGWAERDASIALTLQEERAGAQVRLANP
jgi:3-hydroxyisobutyrate dehydrogenase-like beta-hydroxyacid dehydrogenase